MSKYEDIRALAQETAERIGRSAHGWMGYLDTASRMCRYPFADSLLIYAQRPDAVACASLDVWDHRMGRWVRRGAKGIALIDDDGPRRRLRYVFDISDTYRPRGGRTPFLWQMGEQHRGAISGHLREDYMLAGEGADGLQGALMEIASGLADEGIEDILAGMEREAGGIFTDGPVGDGPLPRFKMLLGDSVFYLLSRRCGLDPMERLGEGAFAGIAEFGDMAMLAFLGDTSSSLAAPVLTNIGREMHKLCREEARQKAMAVRSAAPSKDGADSTAQRGADATGGERAADAAPPRKGSTGQDRAVYMGQDRKDSASSTGPDKADDTWKDGADGTGKDRDNDAGKDGAGYVRKDEKGHTGQRDSAGADTADLPSRGGLPVPGSDDRGGADGGPEVRDAAEKVPERASEGAVPEHAPDRGPGQPSGGDRPGRRGTDGDPDGDAPGAPSSAGQGGGPDGLGRAHGGPDGHGGGERPGGAGVPLGGRITGEDLSRAGADTVPALASSRGWQGTWAAQTAGPSDLPTVEEQVRRISERTEVLYAGRSAIPPGVVGAVLRTGGGRDGSLSRIIHACQIWQGPEGYTEAIRREYGTGGKGLAIGGRRYSVWYDGQGMRIAEGDTALYPSSRSASLSWGEVGGRIRQLLEQGEYAPQDVIDGARDNAIRECAQMLCSMERDMAEGVAEQVFDDLALFDQPYPQDVEQMAALLAQPAYLDGLAERMGELAGIYADDRDVMIRHIHRPDKALGQLEELQRGVRPYRTREGVSWDAPSVFITQDGVDAYLIGGGHVDRRLEIYAFFLQDKTARERADFLKGVYGTGGESHALPGSDRSHAAHDGKGLRLTEGAYGSPVAEVYLSWSKAAARIGTLIEEGRFLVASDLSRMPGYEREQIGRQIYLFYDRMPRWIRRPFGDGPFWDAIKELADILADRDAARELVAGMGADLAALPPDHGDREQLGRILTDVGRYVDGEYTIFPDRKASQAGGYEQLSLADFMDMGTGEPRVWGPDGHGPGRGQKATHGQPDGGIPEGERPGEGIDGSGSQGEDPKGNEGQATGEQGPKGQDSEGQYTGEELSGGQHPGAEVSREGPSEEQHTEGRSPTNFRITDDDLGAGGPKQKFRANMAAIRLLKQLEAEGRQASKEEQEVLSRFVGWGGIPQAFDGRAADWSREYAELGQVLTPEEYKAARASTLNAFYTPPVVIKAMYSALRAMGLEAGNVLEPACGIGNFMGLVPEDMEGVRMYGVELDSISGRTARQLYPENAIAVQGFETTEYPDDFFDCVIGNVPFGDYKVADPKYDRHHFLIHDHFIAKALDLVRPGGVVAVVTSRGTMDKEDSSARRYFAARADLLGAIRLPEDAFRRNAGTSVVADILFFQKRDRAAVRQPDWVGLKVVQDGYPVNAYFADHPEMILGSLTWESGRYGRPEMTVKPGTDEPIAAQLERAASRIQGRIPGAGPLELGPEGARGSILADPSVKDYSFTDVDGEVYYRIGSRMERMELPAATKERVLGMAGIRDTLQELIRCQMEDGSDEEVAALQGEMDGQYDRFTARYGAIGSSANRRAFSQDSSYCLLASLEHLDTEGRLVGKADIFTERTIRKARPVTSVDTASEALAVSIGERARVDLPFMAGLAGMTEQKIIEDLAGVIFKDPATGVWETSDAYLSGNVREKLRLAKEAAADHPEYAVNVRCLERVQPEDLEASQIEARLGAPWIGEAYITQFMGETFHTPRYLLGQRVAVRYTEVSGQWHIAEKSADSAGNPLATSTYGTKRANAYRLLEDTLNLRDTRIYDTAIEDGKEKRVLNKQETILAQQKQEMIREAFKEWVFQDMDRREDLCRTYNERFNSVRPREYDGQHIRFVGMDPRIALLPHQKDAIAHILYGRNTLLAHCVGAGKTFQMIAAGMESRRLGLSQKNLYVVPNHLIEQWAGDFLRLYPGASILAATKRDFEPMERKKFCSRIATGAYDGIIIGQSQFERIPLSRERQAAYIERQIEDITMAIVDAEREEGARYTVKQMEKTKRSLEAELGELNDRSQKDDVVTFEQLGVDRLFIDESQAYKNLFLHTKMRNVAGISQTDAKKSTDLFMKCRYLDEVTGGRGVVFASGTPVSNSVTELYSLMQYLQYDTLQEMGLGHFDSWAAAFGETVTSIELSPEGTGYRARTRFAKFFNLPELMSVFKECADIKTADQLDLPVPEAEYVNVVLQPSEEQRALVRSFADRAERVRKGGIAPSVDNMLAITNDGRKCALDQRLLDDMLPDDPESKVNHCVQDVFSIWEGTMEERSAQIIFCDSSTPKGDGSFNIYDDVREKLVAKGIPREEIAFIHEAGAEAKKEALFAKVRSGQVRVLIGSTAKLGAGTNVQDKLIALYHLDCPWRPADLEQQEGRILRQGNQNKKVRIFRYVTQDTFDAYLWQTLENKQKFISQIMTSKSPVRSCEDIDDAALSYAEVKALATGDPYIREKMALDMEVGKLKLLKAGHDSQRYRMETDIARTYPARIEALEERIRGLQDDGAIAGPLLDALAGRGADGSRGPGGDGERGPFTMTVDGERYTDRKKAGAALIAACQRVNVSMDPCPVGMLPGFMLSASYDLFSKRRVLAIKGRCSYRIEVGKDPLGNLQRIHNALAGIGKELQGAEQELESVRGQLEVSRVEVQRSFPQERELKEKMARLAELDALLDMGGKGSMGGYEGQDAQGGDSRVGGPEGQKEGAGSREDGAGQADGEGRPSIKEDRPLTRMDLKKMRGQSMTRPAGWQGTVRERDCTR